jgi:hypothetical protein
MKKLLLLLLLPIGGLFAQKVPPDCVIPFSFTASGQVTSNSTCGAPNGQANGNGIASWILVYYNYNFSAISLLVQSAPDNNGVPGSWGAFGGTVLTSTQYPGSSGVNPNTATTSMFTGLAGYYPWMRVQLASVGGTGKVTGALYGFYNSTLAKAGSGGGGGGGGPTIAGTANEITVTGAGCTSPSTATCTISIPNNPIFPGVVTAGGFISAESFSGNLQLSGLTSGNVTLTVADIAGTAIAYMWPSANGTAGQILSDTGVATCPTLPAGAPTVCHQLAWISGGSGFAVQVNGTPLTGLTTLNLAAGSNVTLTPTGSGTYTVTIAATGGAATGGATNGYSAPAVTLPAAGTTFIPPVGGGLPSSTETNVQWTAPVTAAISNLGVLMSAAIGTGNTISFTFSDNTTPQTVTCTASGTGAGGTVCSDLTHSFNVTAGDKLTIRITTTGIVAIAPTITIGFEYGGGGGGGGGGSTRGTFTSRPTCSTSGSSYFATDVPIVSECNGSSWADWAYGRNVTLPSAVSFTTVLNGAVITTNGVAQINAVAGNNAYGEDIALPSTPYTLYLGFRCGMITGGGYCGLYVRDTTGTNIVTYAFQALGSNSANFQVAHFSNYTGFTGGVQDFPTATVNQGIVDNYIKIHDDGTNFTYFICTDRFNCSGSLFSQSRTANLTNPGFLGWFVTGNSGGSGQVNMVVFDFTVTNP